ncbi:hypothetical protein [Peribacillus loiseleuriae]|uniref:Uncharacterized protein n=1 Tax=Peribacillus loiseleuriae TaxID=1679170 RepID=A0A0K9GU17_9BACI|nr:hypothetical protein [Peribacillus loiseleuriae]KMY50184.1 hypothetical protein AC625_12290 [Peribacillus loiseleuriae]
MSSDEKIGIILHLFITTIAYVIFNEGAIFSLNQGTIFSGTITVISFIAYGPICYFIARNFEFGRWKYVFYIPFINGIMYILVIYTTNIRNYFPLDDDNFGVGIMMLPSTFLMWIAFIVSIIMDIHIRKMAFLRDPASF